MPNQGFRSTLPWQSCISPVLGEYSTANCFTKYDNDFCNQEEETFWNKTCLGKGKFCSQFGFTSNNATHCTFTDNSTTIDISKVTRRVAASEEFFRRRMLLQTHLGKVDTWEDYGPPQWEVIGCLALAWTLVALSLVKGMQSYGKLTYFITLFPYLVLTIFLVMGSFEEGFAAGITDYYLKPDWNRLFTDYKVWVAACTQIFFSLGVGMGSQLLLCSYNSFNTNCHRDAWLIALANSLTSIFAGFVVFGTLGMLAKNNGVAVEEVITGGEGLTFQVYPEAITQMPVAPLFSFLFFLMLCLLAMSSIVGMWEPIVAALLDELPFLRKRRTIVYITSCIFAFLGGLSCCFPSGIFMFGLLNDHTANTILYFGFAEVIVVAWLYRVKNFLQNIKDMSIPMPRQEQGGLGTLVPQLLLDRLLDLHHTPPLSCHHLYWLRYQTVRQQRWICVPTICPGTWLVDRAGSSGTCNDRQHGHNSAQTAQSSSTFLLFPLLTVCRLGTKERSASQCNSRRRGKPGFL